MGIVIQERIDIYISHFRDHLNLISALETTEDKVFLYKKILYVSVIDALSKAIYPRKSNRVRFVSFVENFTDFKFFGRVSLPHLHQLLKRLPDPPFQKIRKIVFNQMTNWIPGHVMNCGDDLPIDQIKKYWPKETEYQNPLPGIWLDTLKHSSLLYINRNSMIHEFAEKGLGDSGPFDELQKEPYYMHVSGDKDFWSLQYPCGFFKRITESALDKISEYFRRNNIDPIQFYSISDYWIEEID